MTDIGPIFYNQITQHITLTFSRWWLVFPTTLHNLGSQFCKLTLNDAKEWAHPDSIKCRTTNVGSIDGLQKRRNSIAKALELRLFCFKPLKYMTNTPGPYNHPVSVQELKLPSWMHTCRAAPVILNMGATTCTLSSVRHQLGCFVRSMCAVILERRSPVSATHQIFSDYSSSVTTLY